MNKLKIIASLLIAIVFLLQCSQKEVTVFSADINSQFLRFYFLTKKSSAALSAVEQENLIQLERLLPAGSHFLFGVPRANFLPEVSASLDALVIVNIDTERKDNTFANFFNNNLVTQFYEVIRVAEMEDVAAQADNFSGSDLLLALEKRNTSFHKFSKNTRINLIRREDRRISQKLDLLQVGGFLLLGNNHYQTMRVFSSSSYEQLNNVLVDKAYSSQVDSLDEFHFLRFKNF